MSITFIIFLFSIEYIKTDLLVFNNDFRNEINDFSGIIYCIIE